MVQIISRKVLLNCDLILFGKISSDGAEFEKKLSKKLASQVSCPASKIWIRDVKAMIALPYRQEVTKAIAFVRRLPPSAQDRNA